MSNDVYTKENETYKLTVFQDEDPESPREWSNIGTMACAHKRYSLGDEKADQYDQYSSWEEQLEEEILKPNGGEDAVVYLPLYLYDHSGITMNTTGFGCPWDSGQVGWIYATKQKFRDETGYMEEELFSSDKHRVPKLKEHVKVKGYLLQGTDGWGQVIGIADGKFLVKDSVEENEKRIKTILGGLAQEIQNLLPAETIDELEQNLQIPKQEIAFLVKQMGEIRNKMQSLETTLQQHNHQLSIIQEYHKIKIKVEPVEKKGIHVCPQCGYTFDEEIYNIVRSNYNIKNEEYMYQQIQLIMESISEELDDYKKQYVELMAMLKEKEQAFDESQEAYGVYTRQRGLDFDYNKIPSFKKAENVVSASLEEIAEVMSNRAEEMLKGEVETYDDYLTGRVYGYVIEKKETCACCGTVSEEHVDSCWGFYGDSAKEDMIGQVGAEFADLFSDM